MSEALRQVVFVVVDLLVKNAEDEAGSNINEINLPQIQTSMRELPHKPETIVWSLLSQVLFLQVLLNLYLILLKNCTSSWQAVYWSAWGLSFYGAETWGRGSYQKSNLKVLLTLHIWQNFTHLYKRRRWRCIQSEYFICWWIRDRFYRG